MRKLNIATIVIIAVVVTVAAAVSGIGIAAWVHSNNNNNQVTKSFIGNIPGITEQDIRLCRGSYVNGGRYYHRIYNATLECSYNHISVDFDHEE